MVKLNFAYTEAQVREHLQDNFHITFLHVLGQPVVGQTFMVANHLREDRHFYSFVLVQPINFTPMYKCVYKEVRIYSL